MATHTWGKTRKVWLISGSCGWLLFIGQLFLQRTALSFFKLPSLWTGVSKPRHVANGNGEKKLVWVTSLTWKRDVLGKHREGQLWGVWGVTFGIWETNFKGNIFSIKLLPFLGHITSLHISQHCFLVMATQTPVSELTSKHGGISISFAGSQSLIFRSIWLLDMEVYGLP